LQPDIPVIIFKHSVYTSQKTLSPLKRQSVNGVRETFTVYYTKKQNTNTIPSADKIHYILKLNQVVQIVTSVLFRVTRSCLWKGCSGVL